MKNVPIEGANCTIGEKQPEYTPLVGKREVVAVPRADTGELYEAMSIECGFELATEEALVLLNGGKLHVRMQGGWTPVAIWVE